MSKEQTMPSGFYWIIVFLIFSMLGAVLVAPLLLSIGMEVGLFDITIELGSIVIGLLILLGIYKRLAYTYYLAMTWFFLSICFELYALATIHSSQFLVQLVATPAKILMFGLFLWYFAKRKNYFFTKDPVDLHHPDIARQEQLFKIIVIALFIIILLVPLIGSTIHDTYRQYAIKGAFELDTPAAIDWCETQKRSLIGYCINHVVKHRKGEFDFGTGEVCLRIIDPDYRNGCYIILDMCEKVTNEEFKHICESTANLRAE